MIFKIFSKDENGNPIFTEYPNQIVYEIITYQEDMSFVGIEDEFLKYVFEVRKEQINRLKFNNSLRDKMIVEVIKSIERRFINHAIESIVKNDFWKPDFEILNNYKPFEYTPNQKDNNYKLPKWGKELVKVLIKKGEIKHNDLVIELEKKGSFPQSYCGNLTKIFKTENAKEFLKKEISHSGYWKLNNPEKMKELSSN